MPHEHAYREGDGCVDVASYESAVREIRDLLPGSVPSFCRSAYRLLDNAADAEDAGQDALFSAYKQLGQFERQPSMSTWLISMVCKARARHCPDERRLHLSLDEQLGEERDTPRAETPGRAPESRR